MKDLLINVLFVISIGNPVVEGMFNKYDLYGNVQLDFFRKEGWLIFIDAALREAREARRQPEMRSASDLSDDRLTGHASSCAQLEQYGLDFMASIVDESTEQYNIAAKAWKEAMAERKAELVKVLKWSNACMQCHDGGDLMLCELCPSAAHLKCTGLTKEPENWFCPDCVE